MQATATLATSNRRKFILPALGLALLLALVAVALVYQSAGSEGQVGSPAVAASNARAAGEMRLRALNELPGAAAANPLSANPRFLDMNQLTEAKAAAGTVSGQPRIGFLEWAMGESVVLGSTETYNPAIDRDGRPN